MKNQKKFFFQKDENAVKELLTNEQMKQISGGLYMPDEDSSYTRGGTYLKVNDLPYARVVIDNTYVRK